MRLDEILRAKQDERAAIIAKTAPLRAERDKIAAEIRPKEDRIRELNQRVKAIEQESGLYELDVDISQIARGMGAKRMNAETLKVPNA